MVKMNLSSENGEKLINYMSAINPLLQNENLSTKLKSQLIFLFEYWVKTEHFCICREVDVIIIPQWFTESYNSTQKLKIMKT